jgi:hypothetical protein
MSRMYLTGGEVRHELVQAWNTSVTKPVLRKRSLETCETKAEMVG